MSGTTGLPIDVGPNGEGIFLDDDAPIRCGPDRVRLRSSMNLRERLEAVGWVRTWYECWHWRGTVDTNGYGRLNVGTGSRKAHAHRVMWEVVKGAPIPDGMFVCHSCDNRACVNPGHLFLGTAADNTADAAAKSRMARGEEAGAAKLSDADVAAIRSAWAKGSDTQRALAARYDVDHMTIHRIVNNKARQKPGNPGRSRHPWEPSTW